MRTETLGEQGGGEQGEKRTGVRGGSTGEP